MSDPMTVLSGSGPEAKEGGAYANPRPDRHHSRRQQLRPVGPVLRPNRGGVGYTTLRLVWLGFGRSRTELTKCPTTDPIKSP